MLIKDPSKQIYKLKFFHYFISSFLIMLFAGPIHATEKKIVTATIGVGSQNSNGNGNPNWVARKPNGNPVAMMEELCQSQRSVNLLNVGQPTNGGGNIGFCNASPDGYVYRCDGDGDPNTVDNLCANYSEQTCSIAGSFNIDCALVVTVNKCDYVGGPCHVGTGNKRRTVKLFDAGNLSVSLTYNSLDVSRRNHFGFRWTSNFHKELYVNNNIAHYINEIGDGYTWIRESGDWVAQNDFDYLLAETNDGYLVTDKRGTRFFLEANPTREIFLVNREVDSQGREITYEYSDLRSGQYRNITVTNQYGHSIFFRDREYVMDPSGNRYEYFSPQSTGVLSQITFPDETVSRTDNPRLIFHYENQNFPYNLTGITDQNGDRFATFSYDVDGKASSTEYAQTTNPVGQERFQLNHQGAN